MDLCLPQFERDRYNNLVTDTEKPEVVFQGGNREIKIVIWLWKISHPLRFIFATSVSTSDSVMALEGIDQRALAQEVSVNVSSDIHQRPRY